MVHIVFFYPSLLPRFKKNPLRRFQYRNFNANVFQMKIHPSRRYLRCPAAVSIQHLQKLIRAKYGLSPQHRVDVLYKNETLSDDFTLMDVAYIYLWRRKVPLHLTYRIFEVAKRAKLEKSLEKEEKSETWKEVQLTISENGVMSVTNVEDAGKVELKMEVVEEPKTGEKRKSDAKEEEVSAKVAKVTTTAATAATATTATTATTTVTTPQLKNVQQLSRNHPLKIHSQTIKNHAKKTEGEKKVTVPVSVPVSVPASEPSTSTPTTVPVTAPSVVQKPPNTQAEQPKAEEVQKASVTTSTSTPKYTKVDFCTGTTTTTSTSTTMTSTQPSGSKAVDTVAPRPALPNSIQYSRVSIVPKKSPVKPPPPVSYKTLRDPPKPWNPQLPPRQLLKPGSSSDQKPEQKLPSKPAKFFKMRNNMPRYLGNPASGVKPMFQVREGDVSGGDAKKSDERPKAAILKIDPKTLKPMQPDVPEMKINQSTVPILNPLRTQKSSSPKMLERRSPKNYPDGKGSPRSPLDRGGSPLPHKLHSPKPSVSSPTSKKDKLNLNFTPPNPFIPNPASPNLAAPNQFLYPNFPSYNLHIMKHALPNLSYLPSSLSMFYPPQQRLGYPLSPLLSPTASGLIPNLGLELAKRSAKPSSSGAPNHDADAKRPAAKEPPRQNGESGDKKKTGTKTPPLEKKPPEEKAEAAGERKDADRPRPSDAENKA